MITRERAVERAEALLIVERRKQPHLPELAVTLVEEHEFGWLVYWNSAEFVRYGGHRGWLVGHGPYLVDRLDGSVHHIPETTIGNPRWEQLYREQVRGERPPDPLLDAVREVLARDGFMPAWRHLRRETSRLTLGESKDYIDAVREGGEPPEELLRRLRPDPPRLFGIDTLAGPVA
ncbi:MAG TPA: YrhB domain-containing protein [Actinoplanes sp.]|nr:YrhB domain-containing protein [Actinoplanes sp.]